MAKKITVAIEMSRLISIIKENTREPYQKQKFLIEFLGLGKLASVGDATNELVRFWR